MRILFRYDDYSEISNVSVDLAVLSTLIEAGIVPLVGVIPSIADVNWALGNYIPLKRLSVERVQFLAKLLPHIDVALHGYTHQAVTRYSGLFEFGDAVNLSRQVERLRDGKEFLENSFGVKINWFIPPWNSYGTTTLDALKQSGFKGISADAAFGPVSDDLCFAPATGLVHELNLFARFAHRNSLGDVIVVLHDYDFQESGSSMAKISISEFKRLLDNLKKIQISPVCWSDLIEDLSWGSRRACANQSLRKYTTGPIRYLLAPGFNSIYWEENFALKKCSRLTKLSSVLKNVLFFYRKL
jgi:peptidoglycan/xylan/chitin deacetylase (PgdA/CDA1 family)